MPDETLEPRTHKVVCREFSEAERRAWLWDFPGDYSMPENEHLSWLLLRWFVDPVLFCFEALRVALMPYQAQALLDLSDAPEEVYRFYGLDPTFPKRQVLLPSGHGLGKTRVLAIAIWRHLLTRMYSKVLCTAPTAPQLTVQLWGEVRKMYRRLRQNWPQIASEWEVQGSSIVHSDPANADWHCVARTSRADKPEGMQGAHAMDIDDEFGDLASLFDDEFNDSPTGGILVIIEEGSGVDDVIRKTLEGALSEEGACLLSPGNPTRPDGWFAEDMDKTDRYAVHHLDCRMSDRTKTYSLPYRDFSGKIHHVRLRGFVQPRYWEDVLEDCDGDEDHDVFKVRVRGLKPSSAFDQCIKTHWVDMFFARERHEASKSEPVIIGLDFGLSSDKHAMAIRQGYNMLDGEEWLPKDKPDEVTLDAVDRAIEAQRIYGAKFIIGDSNGVGKGAMETLTRYYREEKPELNVTVIHFNSGAGALDKKRYYRRRDEMWHKYGRAFFASQYANGPEIKGFKRQLTVTGYHENDRRIIAAETKEQIKKRTSENSGNLADAFLQTLMVTTAKAVSADSRPKKQAAHPAIFQRHFDRLKRIAHQTNYIR